MTETAARTEDQVVAQLAEAREELTSRRIAHLRQTIFIASLGVIGVEISAAVLLAVAILSNPAVALAVPGVMSAGFSILVMAGRAKANLNELEGTK